MCGLTPAPTSKRFRAWLKAVLRLAENLPASDIGRPYETGSGWSMMGGAMATYHLSEEALKSRLHKARLRLRVKYGLLTLLVACLGLLNYEKNDQRHWQTELVALGLCAILLIAGYSSGERAFRAAETSPLDFYRLTVGSDCVECKDTLRGTSVLHVGEIAKVRPSARGIWLRSARKGRCILVRTDLENYQGCVAELRSIGIPV